MHKILNIAVLFLGVTIFLGGVSQLISDYSVHKAKRVVVDPKGDWDELYRYRVMTNSGGSLEARIYYNIARWDYGVVSRQYWLCDESYSAMRKIAEVAPAYYNAARIVERWSR